MLPDRVSNPGPLTYESGALPIALRGPARKYKNKNKGHSLYKKMGVVTKISIRSKALDASSMAHVFSLI